MTLKNQHFLAVWPFRYFQLVLFIFSVQFSCSSIAFCVFRDKKWNNGLMEMLNKINILSCFYENTHWGVFCIAFGHSKQTVPMVNMVYGSGHSLSHTCAPNVEQCLGKRQCLCHCFWRWQLQRPHKTGLLQHRWEETLFSQTRAANLHTASRCEGKGSSLIKCFPNRRCAAVMIYSFNITITLSQGSTICTVNGNLCS